MLVLAIETFVEARRKELRLSKAELVHRAGCRNISKGMKRLEQLYSGDFRTAQGLISGLPAAIEVPFCQIESAIIESKNRVAEDERLRRVAEARKEQAALAFYAKIIAGTSISIPFAVASIIGSARLANSGYKAGRRTFLQGLGLVAAAAAFPSALAANSLVTLRLKGLKIGSPEYEAGLRAYRESKRPPNGFQGMMAHWRWAHNCQKEFNEMHRDILTPADPGPGFAHGNFKW